MEEQTSEGSRTPYRSSRKHDRALPYKKRVVRSNDTQRVSQSETEIHPSNKISSSTTFNKDEVSASASLLKLRDPRGKIPPAMPAGNEASVKKSEGDKVPVRGPRSIRIRFGNQSVSIRSDLPLGDGDSKDGGSGVVGDTKQADKTTVTENEVGDGDSKDGGSGVVGDTKQADKTKVTENEVGDGVSKDGGSGVVGDTKQVDKTKVTENEVGDGVSKDGGSSVGDTKQADKTKAIEENEVGDDTSNGKEPLGDGHGKNGAPTGAVGDRKKANDARGTVGKGKQTSKLGKGVMKQEGGNGKSNGSEPHGINGSDGSPVFVDGKQTDQTDKIKEVIEYEGGRGGGNTGSEPADDAKGDESGDGKTASKRKEVIENKVGGGGSTEPQGENDCKDGTTSVIGDRKQAEKIKVGEHGGGGFLPIEMAVEGKNAGICEADHEKEELTEKEDGGDNINSAPGEEQSIEDKDLLEHVVSTTVYPNEPDVVEHGKQVHLADRVTTNIEGSRSRLPADVTLTQSLVLEDGSRLSPADSTDERDKNGKGESSFHVQGQVVAVEDASDNKNNRNMEPGREEETIEGKKTVDDIVSTKVRDEVEPEGGQEGRRKEIDMIIGEEKTDEDDPVTKLVGIGRHSPVDTTIKTARNEDNIEDLYEPKKNLKDGGNEGIINELVEQDQKGKKTVDRYVVSTIIHKAGSGTGMKEPEGGHDCNNNPPDVGNEEKLKQADQITNSAGCGDNASPTNLTLGRGSDANTEGNHEKRKRKVSFLLPDDGRGNDSSIAPAGDTPSRYTVTSGGYKPTHGISNIQMLQDAKTISSGSRKRSHNSQDQGEVSQDRVGGDAVGQKGTKKYKDGSNEVSGIINSNAPGCNEPPEEQASHTFRLFGVDIDVPGRESIISPAGGGHDGGESSMKEA